MTNSVTNKWHNKKILISSDVDFSGFPYGGILSLLKDYLKYFPPEFAEQVTLMGITTQKEQVGRCGIKQFGSNTYRYLAVTHIAPSSAQSIRLSYNLGVINQYFTVRKLHSDVIYAHTNENGLLMKMLFPARKVVVHFHGIENPVTSCRYPILRHSPLPGLYNLLCVRLLIHIADRIIVNIDSERFESFIGRYPNQKSKFVRIPPLIDTDTFRPYEKSILRQQLGFEQNENILAFHGRLEYPKGVDLVISAFKIIVDQVKNCRLIIIGDGSQKKILEEQVLELKLGHRVIFTGNITRNEISRYLACADIFVTGTHFEAISVALLEAIGCGLPVVTTPVGGVNDIVRNGYNGFCLDKRSPEEMAQKIIFCLKMDRKNLRENVLETGKLFYPEKVIPQIQKAVLGWV